MSENGQHQWIKNWPRAFLRSDMSETPVDLLARHWMNERHAPEILPAQEALLSSILDHLKRYVPSVPFFENTQQLMICQTFRGRTNTAWRPFSIRRRTSADHPCTARHRARQVHRQILHSHATIQGLPVHFPTILSPFYPSLHR